MPYTVADLENARARLERAHDHADNSRSNNPNKGRGEIRNATREVDIILAELKARGLLEKTDKEKLSDEIDRYAVFSVSVRAGAMYLPPGFTTSSASSLTALNKRVVRLLSDQAAKSGAIRINLDRALKPWRT